MNINGFDKLKEIGAQKIHERTHISREHVQAILHDSFEGMNKIQFLGFVSILERDYNVELNELKIRGLEYFLNITSVSEEVDNLFEESNNSKTIYIVLILLAVVIVIFLIFNGTFFNNAKENSQKIDDANIEKIKENIIKKPKIVIDKNSSIIDENNSTEDTQIAIKKQIEQKVVEIKKSFKIMPNTKLWIGYTDLKQNKTYQKLFRDELSLDSKKAWLLSLGHGNVNFEVNGKIIEYRSRKNLKFLYKENNLTKITFKKFNTIKKDNRW